MKSLLSGALAGLAGGLATRFTDTWVGDLSASTLVGLAVGILVLLAFRLRRHRRPT